MAKKKGSKRAKAKAVAKRAYSGAKKAAESRPGKIIMATAETGAGALLLTQVVNRAPMISTMNRPAKALALLLLGGGSLYFIKNRHLKFILGGGGVLAGLLTGAKEYLKLDAMAGNGGRALTPTEFAQIRNGQMNMPLSQRMNMPANAAPVNAGFGGGFGS